MKRLVVISGRSASGKTTVAKQLLNELTNARLVVSTTTRAPRHNDLPGEYMYISEERFCRMLSEGKFLWSDSHGGNRYGTLAQSIDEIFDSGDAIGFMLLTPSTRPKLQKYLESIGKQDECLWIYLHAHESVLRSRIEGRGDDPQNVTKRLEESKDWPEIANQNSFFILDGERSVSENAAGIQLLIMDGKS